MNDEINQNPRHGTHATGSTVSVSQSQNSSACSRKNQKMAAIMAKQKNKEEAWKEERYAANPKILMNMRLLTKMQKTERTLSDLEQRNDKSIEFLNHIRQDNKKMHNQLA